MFFEYPALLWLLAIPVLLLVRYIWLEVSGRLPHFRASTLQPWEAGGGTVATPGGGQ